MIKRCKKCGHNQKTIDLENLLYTLRCDVCGKVLKKGKKDVMNLYKQYLQSDHWQTTRRLALEHYDNVCDECGTTTKLEVHHLTYENKGKERLADLQILCRECHEKKHDN